MSDVSQRPLVNAPLCKLNCPRGGRLQHHPLAGTPVWSNDMPFTRLDAIKSRTSIKDGVKHIYIYDEIGPWFWGMYGAETFLDDVDNHDGPLEVHLNTPGGDVFEGLAIYNLMNQFSHDANTTIDALAYSMGSILAMGGKRIRIAESGTIGIHKPWTIAWGDSIDMRSTADVLDEVEDTLIDIYAARTGNDKSQLQKWLGANRPDGTRFRGQDAVDNFFANEVLANVAGDRTIDGEDLADEGVEDSGASIVINASTEPASHAAEEDVPVEPQKESFDWVRNRMQQLEAIGA